MTQWMLQAMVARDGREQIMDTVVNGIARETRNGENERLGRGESERGREIKIEKV